MIPLEHNWLKLNVLESRLTSELRQSFVSKTLARISQSRSRRDNETTEIAECLNRSPALQTENNKAHRAIPRYKTAMPSLSNDDVVAPISAQQLANIQPEISSLEPQATIVGAPEITRDVTIRDPNQRISLPPDFRLIFGTMAGTFAGFGLGLAEGARVTGYRYRAENAHRLPKTLGGWYFYHKTKNYVVTVGAVKEGLRMAPKIGFWSGMFFWTENMVDVWRGGGTQRDFLSTVVAALALNGAFSLWRTWNDLISASHFK